MKLIKNDDFHEEPTMTTAPSDDELEDLFSLSDDPAFLSACEEGHAQLRELLLDKLPSDCHPGWDEPHAPAPMPNNGAADIAGWSPAYVALLDPSPPSWSPGLRRGRRVGLLAAAAAVMLTTLIGSGWLTLSPPLSTTTQLASSADSEPTFIPPDGESTGTPPSTELSSRPVRSATALHGGTAVRAGAVIEFSPDASALSADGEKEILEIVSEMPLGGADKVTVRGFSADPPGSTPGGRTSLSEARAKTVADALVANGIPREKIIVDVGGAPEVSAMAAGTFDENLAAHMRRVEITYS